MLAGATVQCSERFSAGSFDAAFRAGITIASLVPTMLRTLLHETDTQPLPGSLRAILIGGGPCTPALAQAARESGFPILLTWGMSEAGSQIATQSLTAKFSTTDHDLSTVGALLPGFELQSEQGVALVRGPSITMGYHPSGAAPAAIDRAGWLNTRDRIERAPGGDLRIIGRGTDLIISGGENVYPAEVEAVLEALPYVRAACVFGLPDEKWGERVHAAIHWTDAPRNEDVLRAIRLELGPLKCPRGLHTVELLPQTANGKIDRAAVRDACLRDHVG
ncbi:MAG: O-succinylbenzoic acid--CoA ligase [Bradymonadia bacterium]|jgi:O-succinylbenzoic acid--CoA ligase